MRTIKTGFTNYSYAGLSNLLNNVVDKLRDNAALFPDLPVPLATLQTLAAEYTASNSAATRGSAVSKAARTAKAGQVMKALSATGSYVNMIALGRAVVLTNSGFELVKQREPFGPVGKPMMKSVKPTGIVGEVALVWTPRPGARTYHCFQTATDPTLPNTVWTHVRSTTKARCKLTGLTAYKPYWFAVQALGTAGPGAMSSPMLGRAA